MREPFKSKSQTAPIYLESAFEHNGSCAVVLSADMRQIQRSEDSPELALSELAMGEEDKRLNNRPIAGVRFVADGDLVPAAAKNYKGDGPDIY